MLSAFDATTAEPRNVDRAANTRQATSGVSMFCLTVLVVPLFWWNHASYVLPFPYVLAVQIATVVGVWRISSVTTCLLSYVPGTHVQIGQQVCQRMKHVMHYLGLLLAKPAGQLAETAATECAGLNGLVLLSLYASVVILVLVPCLSVYFLELNLKMGFIRQRQLVLLHAPPCLDTRLARAVIVYAAVVCSWIACEGVVMALSPIQCGSSGIVLPL